MLAVTIEQGRKRLECSYRAVRSGDVYRRVGGRAELDHGRDGEGCRALDKLAAPEDKAGSREVLDYRAGLLQQLGWAHWHRHETSRLKDLFPPSYPLF